MSLNTLSSAIIINKFTCDWFDSYESDVCVCINDSYI
jgi:hypothetical protein